MFIVFSDLEKHVDNFSKLELEFWKEYVKLKQQKKTLNIWQPCNGMKV
jgi:hypothetical protein